MRREKVEITLDPETHGKLEEIAAARGSTVSELVRSRTHRVSRGSVGFGGPPPRPVRGLLRGAASRGRFSGSLSL
jgi:Ribbon-helix-helix protein, copG family